MNEQNRPTEPTAPASVWRSHPRLFTALACLVTGIVVFLATFFSVTRYYGNEIEDYRAHYVKSSGKYDAGLIEAALGLLDTDSIFDLPDRQDLTEAMIEAAIAAMGDRYGTFFTDAEHAAYSSNLAGRFVGIGVSLQRTDGGNARITLVHKGSPAEESGLRAGDEIVSVDGIRFDSKHEARVYESLMERVKTGELKCVCRQVKFDLPGGIRYIADFVTIAPDNSVEVIDAKSDITRKNRVYINKKKQMKACWGLEVKEA